MSKHGRLARILGKTATDTRLYEAPKYVRSSQIARLCPWEEYFKSKHYKEPVMKTTPMTRELDLTFTLGTFVHEYLQSVVIGPLGFLKGEWVCVSCGQSQKDCYYPDECTYCAGGTFHYEEYALFDKDLRLSGHVDGLICQNRMDFVFLALEEGVPEKDIVIPSDLPEKLKHLEIKSANEWSYKSVLSNMEIPEYYRIQSCAYQHMLGIDETLFLYINMNNKKMMVVPYRAEPDLWEASKDKIRTVWEAVDNDCPPPPSTRSCLSLKDKRAKECPFAFECFGTGK